ncbi:MAG: Fic family protein [Chloroflexi bacterium]|nr:Fic family protein [Chloroflexota bacterium]
MEGPPFHGVEWDDELERDLRVVEAIVKGHLRVERWLTQEADKVLLRLDVVTGFHREMFRGVFPELAGRLRGPAPEYIPRNVSFGTFRGVHSDVVWREYRALCARLEQYIKQLDQQRSQADQGWFTDQVLTAAAYAHCELIRIHPFVNGNGRVARTCINYSASRYGFLPVPFERPKGEYLDANRAWLRYRKIEPFKEFLRPLWDGRPENR